MFCGECGEEIVENSKFCQHCGHRQPVNTMPDESRRICVSCNREIPPGQVMCPYCTGIVIPPTTPLRDDNTEKKERSLESKIAIGILLALGAILGLYLGIKGLIDLNNSM